MIKQHAHSEGAFPRLAQYFLRANKKRNLVSNLFIVAFG